MCTGDKTVSPVHAPGRDLGVTPPASSKKITLIHGGGSDESCHERNAK